MKTIAWLAFFEGVILAGILWLNPVFSSIGIIMPPDTGGIGNTAFIAPPMPKGIPTQVTAADIMIQYSTKADDWNQQPPDGATFLSQVEQRVLELTNAERRQKRLKPLKHEDLLQKAARTHSLDMFVRQQNGWDFSKVDELAQRAVNGWMNSPGHRENILRKKFTHLGVGGVGKGDQVWLTQNFASIQAFLKQPLNIELKQGELLNLATNPVSQRRAPVKYAFWLPNKGVLAAEVLSISDQQINVGPGEYRLRFYFPEKGRYLIYPGPQVVVK